MSFPPPSAASPTGEGGGGQGLDPISPDHGINPAAPSGVGRVPAPPTDEPREQATTRPPCSTSSDSRQAEGPSSMPSASGEGNDVALDIHFDPISLKVSRRQQLQPTVNASRHMPIELVQYCWSVPSEKNVQICSHVSINPCLMAGAEGPA